MKFNSNLRQQKATRELMISEGTLMRLENKFVIKLDDFIILRIWLTMNNNFLFNKHFYQFLTYRSRNSLQAEGFSDIPSETLLYSSITINFKLCVISFKTSS